MYLQSIKLVFANTSHQRGGSWLIVHTPYPLREGLTAQTAATSGDAIAVRVGRLNLSSVCN